MNRARRIEYEILLLCKGTTRSQPYKTARPELWNFLRARVEDCRDDEVLAAVKRLEEGGLLDLRKYSHVAARPMDYRDYGDNDGRFFYGEDGDGSDIWLSWTHRTHPHFEELEGIVDGERGDEKNEPPSAGDDQLESLKQIARDKSPLGPLREELAERTRTVRINPHAQGQSFAVGAFPFYEEYGKRAVRERVEAYVKLAAKCSTPELILAQQIEELRREVEGLVDRWCDDFRQDVESRTHGIGDRAVGLPGENEQRVLKRKLTEVARKALREAEVGGRISLSSGEAHATKNSALDSDGAGDDIVPSSLVEGTRGYIERVVRQINACYRHECYDASAVMARRLVETLIVEAYEHHKIDSKIKNQAGDFLHLRELVPLALNEPKWDLGRNAKRALPGLKDIGDRSAHDRRFSAHRHDVEKVASDLRTVVQEFLSIAGLK